MIFIVQIYFFHMPIIFKQICPHLSDDSLSSTLLEPSYSTKIFQFE